MSKPMELPQMKPGKQATRVEQPPPIATTFDYHSPTINVTLTVPLVAWVGWTMPTHTLRLSRSQAATLRSLTMALEERGATLESGKIVARPTDAVKWLLENLQCKTST